MIAGYVGTDPVEKIYLGEELIWPTGPEPTPPYEEQYFTVEAVSAGTFNISRPTGLYYSLNGGAWTAATTSMNLSSGDKVRFKGDEEDIVPSQMFTGNTMDFKVYGNIMSLGYPDDFSVNSLIPESGYFDMMFLGSTGLIDASNLIMPTGVTESCYSRMFAGCTSLVSGPSLPATTLAQVCYHYMFSGCTSLTEGPVISGTGPKTQALSPCMNMFEGCTALTAVTFLYPFNYSTDAWQLYFGYWHVDTTLPASGVFYKAPGADWGQPGEYWGEGVPAGWTIVDYTPPA